MEAQEVSFGSGNTGWASSLSFLLFPNPLLFYLLFENKFGM
jgi:hypothetical protein